MRKRNDFEYGGGRAVKRKKLMFFANDSYVRRVNERELRDFFGESLDIECHTTDEDIRENSLSCDVLLTLTPINLSVLNTYIQGEAEVIQGSRTLLLESYHKLASLPYNTKAVIANISKRTVFQLISFLMYLGIDNIDFFPAYPGAVFDDSYRDIPLCIIPTEIDFAGMELLYGKKIINLLGRRITVDTYKALISKLGLDDKKLDLRLEKLEAELVDQRFTDIPVSMSYRFETILNAVINSIDSGILVLDNDNKIIYTNQAFNKMFHVKTISPRFSYLDNSILPEKTYRELLKSQDTEMSLLSVKEIDKSFIISKSEILVDDGRVGSIFVFKDTTEMENMEMQLRGMIAKKGHTAKYTFKDIIGQSENMKSCLFQAGKIAGIDKTVLILGESGTGKEMFAQAIHNASSRSSRPFVALNCAALTPDLLSSELFGYEEGAFTGAKKGGKKGLFEMAHRGTIFLDEIGDISPEIQIKLLRVLQEQQIRRLGGNEIIPVDVRVIAATNRDLERAVAEGSFRLDLYFRLNAFTIVVPALRERGGDIELICRNILTEMGFPEKKLSQELLDIFYRAQWKGNVRELRNCIEYMAYMGSGLLHPRDLPPNFICQGSSRMSGPQAADIGALFPGFQTEDARILNFILISLCGRPMGRRRLSKLCLESGCPVTEAKVRSYLKYLQESGLIEYAETGGTGARITESGRKRAEIGLKPGKTNNTIDDPSTFLS